MKKALFYILLSLVILYCISPLLWQAITSLKLDSELILLPPIISSHITFEHYADIFRKGSFLKIIFNSAVVAGITTIISLIFGSLAAFALAKRDIRGKGLILAAMLSISMFPPIATVSPLYIIIKALGLRDTLAALIITYTTFALPFSVWVLNNFFAKVPHEIYLASRVDGCTPFQSFYKILLPLSAPGLFATAILIFIFSWNEFLFALTFTSTVSSRTIPVSIALFPGIHEIPWGDIAAASVVVTIPIIILVFAFQRRIVEGLTKGAVKG